MDWFNRHGAAIQGVSALITALAAVIALVAVKIQIDAASRIQREQSAKEIYREFLNLSMANPDFARPDYCALKASPKMAGYEAYVDYLLYTGEQVLQMDAQWQSVVEDHLERHKDYVCSIGDWSGYSDDVEKLVAKFKEANCGEPKGC